MFFRSSRNNILKVILAVAVLVSCWLINSSFAAAAGQGQGRKAVILVIDRIGINDIAKSKGPNLEHLMKNGGIGLMNVRGSSFGWENRESGYLSLNMGRRASYPEDRDQAGSFGRTARENGLEIAVIDKNTDKNVHREIRVLAADEQGEIPYTVTGANDNALLAEFERLYRAADIIIINYGERPAALAGADDILGRISTLIDKNTTLMMVITPNPPADMVRGNYSLTPLIMAGPGLDSGIIASNTTKRPGLIANVDFVPSVMSHFGLKELPGYVGRPVVIKKADGSLNYILKSFAQYKNLKIGRYIIHGFYVTVIVFAILVLYLPVLGRRTIRGPDTARFLALNVITLPMMNYLLSPLLDFSRTYLLSFFIVLASFLLSYLVGRYNRNRMLPLGLFSLITGVTLLAGTFFGGNIHLNSPLGYADVFVGGRYYGMGNDTMGIMLGASILGMFILLQIALLPRVVAAAAGFIYMMLPVIGLSPPLGANVGGTIAAMVVAILTVAVLVGAKPVTWRKIILIIGVVFTVEVGIAYLDAILNSQRTHAGNVLADLLAGNFPVKFLHILWSKLSLFLLMLVVPPWNLILAGEFYIIYKLNRRGESARIQARYPLLAKGFTVLFFGGLVAFMFNDTGIIATAMMYTYLVIPLGLIIDGTLKKDGR